MSRSILHEVSGWYGVIVILLAYTLNSFGVIDADSLIYQLLNLTGALGIILIAWHKKDTQPAVLNIVWLFVALVAIMRIVLK